MTNCGAGYFQGADGQTSCNTCTAGFKCPDETMTAPTACPAGTYQNQTGQTDCKACTGNTYSTGASTGTTACTSCGSNYVNDARNGCDSYGLSRANITGISAAGTTNASYPVTSWKTNSSTNYDFTVTGGSSSTCTATKSGMNVLISCAKNTSFTDNRVVTFTLHQYRGPYAPDATVNFTVTQNKDACGTSNAQSSQCGTTEHQTTKASDSTAGQTCYVCTACTTAYPANSADTAGTITWATSAPSGCYEYKNATGEANCTTYKKYQLKAAGCVVANGMTSCYNYSSITAANGTKCY